MTDHQMFDHDEKIFNAHLNIWNVNVDDKKIVVLDCGLGDTYAFKNIMPKLRKKHNKLTLAVCFPDIFFDEEPGLELISIADAINMFGDIGQFNIYKWMDKNNWDKSLTEAFEKLYL